MLNKDICMLYKRLKQLFVVVLSWGIIYYLVLPVINGKLFLEYGFPLGEKIFYLVSHINKFFYFLYIIIIYLIVYFLIKLKIRTYINGHVIYYNVKFLLLYLFPFIIAQFYSYYLFRDYAFKGYLAISWNESNHTKSFLSGLNIVYLFFSVYLFFIYKFIKKYKVSFYILIILLIINSVFLLGLGGRMYVLPVFLVIIYLIFIDLKVSIFKSKTFYKSLFFLTIIFIFLLFVGIARDDKALNIDNFIFVFLAESFFNWLGAGTFLNYNHIPLFAIPYDIGKAFINLLPTIFFPNKQILMESLQNPYYYEAQVGGTSIVYSSLANFGLLGWLIIIIFFVFLVKKLIHLSLYNIFFRTYVIVLFSLLPFMFFRDSFIIFFKNAIMNAFIIPFIIIFLSQKTFYIVKYILRQGKNI